MRRQRVAPGHGVVWAARFARAGLVLARPAHRPQRPAGRGLPGGDAGNHHWQCPRCRWARRMVSVPQRPCLQRWQLHHANAKVKVQRLWCAIGGSNHVPLAGQKRLKGPPVKELSNMAKDTDDKGYIVGNAGSVTELSLYQRVSAPAALLLRLTQHVLWLLASVVDPCGAGLEVANLLRKHSSSKALHATSDSVCNEMRLLEQALKVRGSRFLVTLHLMVQQHPGGRLSERKFITAVRRQAYEVRVQRVCCDVVKSVAFIEQVEAFMAELGLYGRQARVRAALGDELWDDILEIKCDTAATAPDRALWTAAKPVTAAACRQALTLDPDARKQCPVLWVFFQEQDNLARIRYIASILQWHAVLFEVLQEPLSREDATSITNMDIVQLLPESRRAFGLQVLQEFCNAFNDGFGLVEQLFECQANPFLHQGSVDLSGNGSMLKMEPSTSIVFSLPAVALIQGQVDAPGMCTIRLLDVLQTSHNDLVRALSQAQGPNTAVVRDVRDVDLIPTVDFRTPKELVLQRLLNYNQARDLEDVLFIFSQQRKIEPGVEPLLFDFESIERTLCERILAGASQVAVQVVHFQYAGGLRQSGHLAQLQQRVAQEPLSQAILDLIWEELDTQFRITLLLNQVEDCVNFLVTMGTHTIAGVGPETPLQEFVLSTLLVSKETWEDCTTASVRQLTRLKHLQGLFIALEEHTNGSLLDGVLTKYREALTVEQAADVRVVRDRNDTQGLVTVLRDFLTDQLTDGKWQEDEDLAEYLGYSTEVDLDDLLDQLPELHLSHAFALYQLLIET
eukprot:m.69664 g.69664  ORF g.69664 m.69664 type:complete len:792 (-) comp14008_c0_seq1:251-2626(-)